MFRRASAPILVLAAATFAVAAQPPPSPTTPATAPAQAPAARKPASPLAVPRGPVKITAERADLEQRATALYRGNVKLVSANLTLSGDRLELQQPGRGQIRATLTGKPARLHHRGVDGAQDVAASANLIVYDTQQAFVELTGDAKLDRGADLLTSHTIRYDLVAGRISASGTGAGQVELVIQPPANGVPQNTQPAPGTPPKQ